MRRRRSAFACLVALAWLSGCASNPNVTASESEDYLRYVGVKGLLGEVFAMRFHDRQMPLQVYLPLPPEGFFEDAEAVRDSVRDGFSDWQDVARPGVPSFEYVDEPGAADIRVVWAKKPNGNWAIAHCIYNSSLTKRIHSIEQISVTARREDGRIATLDEVYRTMLHEVGHALGLYGHSPDAGDIMYRSLRGGAPGLSDRDRATLERLYSLGNGTRIPGGKRSRQY